MFVVLPIPSQMRSSVQLPLQTRAQHDPPAANCKRLENPPYNRLLVLVCCSSDSLHVTQGRRSWRQALVIAGCLENKLCHPLPKLVAVVCRLFNVLVLMKSTVGKVLNNYLEIQYKGGMKIWGSFGNVNRIYSRMLKLEVSRGISTRFQLDSLITLYQLLWLIKLSQKVYTVLQSLYVDLIIDKALSELLLSPALLDNIASETGNWTGHDHITALLVAVVLEDPIIRCPDLQALPKICVFDVQQDQKSPITKQWFAVLFK